ncbi:MAG: hypothetical protein RIS88_421 [Pseudomonadota bacterium]|jgi:hypothetical protein
MATALPRRVGEGVQSTIPDAMPGAAAVSADSDRVACTRVPGALVTTAVPEQRTAWTKARRDVARQAADRGWAVLTMPGTASLAGWCRFLQQLAQCLAPGACVLVEYPFAQRRRLYPLAVFCRLRRLRLQGLLHDLDALRLDAPPRREVAILRLFDAIVTHNPVMTAWLRAQGIHAPVAELGLFDYLAPVAGHWYEDSLQTPLRIACAGNLSFPKARYVYDPRWSEVAGVQVSLFGAFFEPQRLPDASPLRFRGSFDPDAPALDGRYHFGLVWDGDAITGCEGRYGRYLRFNNPHKLSLYAALGLPVVVWEEAALARLVHQQGIGVTVRDLRELGALSQRVGPQDYRAMAQRMAALRQSVTRGAFLQRALDELAQFPRRTEDPLRRSPWAQKG